MKVTAVVLPWMVSGIFFPFLHSDIKVRRRAVVLDSGRLISQTRDGLLACSGSRSVVTASVMWFGELALRRKIVFRFGLDVIAKINAIPDYRVYVLCGGF
jgi:hypothetical protein